MLAMVTMGAVNAQEKKEEAVPERAHGPRITFAEREHNYGTIQKGGDGNCAFTFTNTGDEPLILSSVRASCGCTTPKWTQKPVMPGQSGTIAVRYNTNNVGGFSKQVTVTSNAVNNDRVVLKIKGTVKQDQADAQPQAKPAEKPQVKPVEKPMKKEPMAVPVKAEEAVVPMQK